MRTWISGTAASIASTIALAAMGRRELRNGVAPLNGPSQWVWGRHAPYRNGFSARHTLVGYAIHHLASLWWAALYEHLAGRRRWPLAGAAAVTAATAAVVDFKLTPQRFTPGFEHRLSTKALVVVYAAFAMGLAASSLLPRGRR